MIHLLRPRAFSNWLLGSVSFGIVLYAHAQTYTVFDLGVPPVSAPYGVYGNQINANGEVAGSFLDGGQPLVVTNGNRMALAALHLDTSGEAFGINAAGVAIGESCTGDFEQCQGVEWSSDGVPHELVSETYFLPGGINASGDIVGDTMSSPEGFSIPNVIRDGKLNTLSHGNFEPFNGGNAIAINDSGVIAGDLCEPTQGDGFTNCHAVVWTGSSVQDLRSDAGADAINDNGQVAGFARAPNGTTFYAATWVHGKFTDLGAPNGYASVASAINESGVIVGSGATSGYEQSHALVWNDEVMSDLNELIDPALAKQIRLSQAVSINDSGQILVDGYDNSTGISHAYVLSLSGAATVAEPTFSLIPRSYASTQTVALLDATPGATIHYTLDGTQPSSNTATYSSALTIDRTTTIRATAYLASYRPSTAASGLFEIISGAGSVAVNFPAPSVLATAAQGPAIAYGLDGLGNAFASNLIGEALVWSGVHFNFNQGINLNGVADTEIALPAGQFASIKLLATGARGNRAHETYTVTYLDGSMTRIDQGVSDWATPQAYPGESTVLTMKYRVSKTGVVSYGPYNLYGYTLLIDSSKPVKSLKLPASRYIVVLAVTMSGEAASDQSPSIRAPIPQPGLIRIRSE